MRSEEEETSSAGSRLPAALGTPALWWALALGILALRAAQSAGLLVEMLSLPGPNTMGEAGKVYFAAQVMEGQWPFATGQEPPYYPSVHGVLIHAVVGGIGALATLEITDLYYVGRAISVGATLAALAAFWRLGRRITRSVPLAAFGLLLWAGSYALFQHATSYRPDHWLLGLSMAACWLLTRRELPAGALAALAVFPAVAFHTKAPGLALGAAIVGGLWYRRGLRTAAGVAAVQVALVGVSVGALAWVSGGRYLAGLGAATGVGFSPAHALSSLWTASDRVVPLLVAAPALAAAGLGRRLWRGRPVVAMAGIFWTVTLTAYLAAASRAGSNAYYFLEPAGYGALVGMAGLERLREAAAEDRTAGVRFVVGLLVALVPATANLQLWLTQGRRMESARSLSRERTREVGGARFRLAERLNEGGMSCYTDDAGLNVLLERPRVLYPYLQSQMMDAGVLPPDLRERAVREGRYDCVVISGETWSYQGTTALPPSFFEAARESYPRSERVGPYEVRFPPTPSRSGS